MGDEFPFPVPDNPPQAGEQIIVAYNAEWYPAIAGVLLSLRRSSAWETPADEIEGQVDTLIELLSTPMTIQYPAFVVLFPQLAKVAAGDAVTMTVVVQQEFNFVGSQNPANINNQLRYTIMLKAGDYLVRVNGRTFNSAGKVDWYLGSTQVASGQDWYSASTVNNVTKTFTMTVPTDGEYLFSSIVSAKHASSSGYALQVSSIIISTNE